MQRFLHGLILLLGFASLSYAHVGSPDIYLEGNAGPYKLFVSIVPPEVIPGVAEINVRSESGNISELKASPMPLAGEGSKHPPIPEALHRPSADSQFFTGSLWLMADGSWQVVLLADGSQGAGRLAIPVPALARRTRTMDWQLGLILSILGVFLVGGIVAICGAAVREAKLPEDAEPTPALRRRGRIASFVAFVVVALILWGGKSWWDREVNVYKGRVYKPLAMEARLEDPATLKLDLSETGWMQPPPGVPLQHVMFQRKIDDLVPDHDHLMHLYLVREPELDVIYHLHPTPDKPEEFSLALPAMPAGNYRLYADIVHENGLPETLTASLNLPRGIAASDGRALAGDDAEGQAQPVSTATPTDTFTLPDGYQMRWIHDAHSLIAQRGQRFQFELLTPHGGKPADMALYMGMVGHAAFIKTDGTVFAHIHPNGTASMAAMMLAQSGSVTPHDMANMDMSQMDVSIPNQVAFPYGFPTPGRYRIFVQMRHGATIETGIFDALVK